MSRIELGTVVGVLKLIAAAATVSIVHNHTPDWHSIIAVVAVAVKRITQGSAYVLPSVCAAVSVASTRVSIVPRTAKVDCVPDPVLVLRHDLMVVQVVGERAEIRKLLAALIARELFNLLLLLRCRTNSDLMYWFRLSCLRHD